MENSNIYDLLEHTLIQQWRKELEDMDELGFIKIMRECEEEIKATLDENQIELLRFFEVSINNYLDNLYYMINHKILNYGIQIGMQLQQAFFEQSKQ